MIGSRTQTGEALCAAASRSDVSALQELFRAGADPNLPDACGRLPLQTAAAGGHAEAAACLLAYGAYPDFGDAPDSMLHAIRQRYQRFETYEEDRARAYSPRLHAAGAELAARGFLRLPGFIDARALAGMQAGLDTFVREVDGMLAKGEGIKKNYDEELHWAPVEKAYISNNAFKYSHDLVEFCFQPDLLGLADIFLGKPSFVSRGVATRYPAAESPNCSAFAWHHDMEERRLKALILLTDVSETDQHMSYVVGSHVLFHPYEMFLSNACPHRYCEEHLEKVEVVHTIGRAGDVFLFDSNGAHCGIRRPNGALRDAFFVEFATNDSQVWGGDFDQAHIERLSSRAGVNPFHKMLTVQKKWTIPYTRSNPGWVETLKLPDTWL